MYGDMECHLPFTSLTGPCVTAISLGCELNAIKCFVYNECTYFFSQGEPCPANPATGAISAQ